MEFTDFGLCDFNPGLVTIPVPPPEVPVLSTESNKVIVTDDGKAIQIV